MKKCTACGHNKDFSDFYDKKRSKVRADGTIHHWTGKYAKCKKCHDKITARQRNNYDTYYKEYRLKNKSKIAERTLYWYKTNKQEWWKIAGTVTDLRCTVCGYDKHSAALDFHHLDPEIKEGTIHAMMNGPAPNEINIEKFVSEVKKCIVLCSNCHRETHAKYNFIPKIAEAVKK